MNEARKKSEIMKERIDMNENERLNERRQKIANGREKKSLGTHNKMAEKIQKHLIPKC